jgi:hypothetical protein
MLGGAGGVRDMKTSVLIYAFLAFGAFASAGPRTDGGDGGKSTIEEVKIEIVALKGRAIVLMLQLYAGNLVPLGTLDKDVVNVLKKLMGEHPRTGTAEFAMNIREATIEPKENGKCLGIDGESDASTERRIGAPICMNVSNLTRIPHTDLSVELVALFMHELAHQLEFDEPVAVKFQQFIRERFRFQNTRDEITARIGRLESIYRENDDSFDKSRTCFLMGEMTALVLTLPYGTLGKGIDLSKLNEQERLLLSSIDRRGAYFANPKDAVQEFFFQAIMSEICSVRRENLYVERADVGEFKLVIKLASQILKSI